MEINIPDNIIKGVISSKKKDSKYEKCHLKKDVIKFINSAVGVLGPPGAGKSSLCCAYYKIKYNMDNQYFEMSSK